MNKTYLGDGTYAKFDGYGVLLTKEYTDDVNEYHPPDKLYLDREQVEALIDAWNSNIPVNFDSASFPKQPNEVFSGILKTMSNLHTITK